MTLTDLAKTSLGNLGRHRVRTILSAVGVTVEGVPKSVPSGLLSVRMMVSSASLSTSGRIGTLKLWLVSPKLKVSTSLAAV